MSNTNIFDQHFEKVSESGRLEEQARSRLLRSRLELYNAERERNEKLKQLADIEAETNELKSNNRELKINIMRALVERDELSLKSVAIESNIELLNNQLENMKREIDDLLKNEDIDNVCERFALSEQASLIAKIQENRTKLLKIGFPLYKFA